MDGSQVIKLLMMESKTDTNKLAELLGIKPQSVRNKLSRNSFTLSEFEKVINVLDADMQVVSRITKTGFPRDGASSWIPPESVKIIYERDKKL